MNPVVDLSDYRSLQDARQQAKARHPSQWHKQQTLQKLKEMGTCPLCQQETNKEQL